MSTRIPRDLRSLYIDCAEGGFVERHDSGDPRELILDLICRIAELETRFLCPFQMVNKKNLHWYVCKLPKSHSRPHKLVEADEWDEDEEEAWLRL